MQESLTNILKHGRGATGATVTLRYGESGVDVVVDDDGLATDGAPAPGGHGLTGMRERVAVFGGALSAGPCDGGGWRVSGHLGLGSTGAGPT